MQHAWMLQLALIDAKGRKPPYGNQRGLSLVEMAVALFVIGLIMLITMQSKNVIEQYRQTQFTNQVRALKSNLHAFRNLHGRWPGDCNQDGLIDYRLLTTEAATELDYQAATTFIPAASSDADYTLGTVCPEGSLEPYAKLNIAFNELKLSGQSPAAQPNRISAANTLGGVAVFGSFGTTLTAPATLENQFNAVLLTGVSITSARKLAVSIDGFDGSAANVGRVRRAATPNTFAALWSTDGEAGDKKITVVVFFDRIPPTNP